MARIVTIYNDWPRAFVPVDMSYIRWLKISEALARIGHDVDIATAEPAWRRPWWGRRDSIAMAPRLRRVPLAAVRWSDYDVVKTLFHIGFETLERFGGVTHPFIISKLGSVVAAEDMPGVYFYGATRERLASVQERISRTSAYVTLLSEQARDLWRRMYGANGRELLVPGAVDRELPPEGPDPYPSDSRPRCLFAGHVYFKPNQPEANRILVGKLNQLGARLNALGIRVYAVGPGDISALEPDNVAHLGVADYETAWQYIRHAHVGIVVAPGPFVHNNESTKIYHYLRAGLPVVSEAGFPNDHIVGEAGLGFVVPNGDMDAMAGRVADAIAADWNRTRAMDYIVSHHTWDSRARVYDPIITQRARRPAPQTSPA